MYNLIRHSKWKNDVKKESGRLVREKTNKKIYS